MRIYINNTEHLVQDLAFLDQILEHAPISSRNGIAIAVNNKVVPKSTWSSFTIKENDQVLIIKASQGG